jgi:hypothetical protein
MDSYMRFLLYLVEMNLGRGTFFEERLAVGDDRTKAFLLLCMAFLSARDWGKQKYAEGYAAGVATQAEGEK